MALLPEAATTSTELNLTTQPNKSYKMRIDDEKVLGTVDALEAVEQACYKILNTERYQYVIYSWNYGIELQDLFGKPIPYVFSELPRRIREALTQDDRVNDVTDFDLSHNKGDVLATFKVVTASGVIEMQKGVRIL
ncbi:hypothetical protein P22_1956 [Propionispora sp. 2/2-37]|uniref:DUF2634 domain-containing protein n=1 Tax=Propionispora sp. 2/2-37 TaxID=1677858 RepID=UPI0006BB58E4|nr:DUF2634 domain-containing protein [Propionispora sp. 2/2-37]CUH95870.1 hypothetical protein P22_1956 [Propionispora sp. 2/2-37]